MNDQYRTSTLMTSSHTHSATFSLESASGLSLCADQGGRMTSMSGQGHVRVSLTPGQARDLGSLMSGTYGLTGSTSSRSESLQGSLASRLLMLSATAGSTGSMPTWKRKITPSGLCVLALTLPGRRLNGRGSTLLPSVSAREGKDSSQAQILARLDRGDGVAKRICALSPTLRSSQEIVGLNPLFAAWIMGLPSAWISCMP